MRRVLSEALKYHLVNDIPMSEPVFRPGSDEFFSLIREWRTAWFEGRVNDDLVDPWLLETDLGEWGLFEGVEVPLDFPMPEEIAEAEYKGRQVSLGTHSVCRAGVTSLPSTSATQRQRTSRRCSLVLPASASS